MNNIRFKLLYLIEIIYSYMVSSIFIKYKSFLNKSVKSYSWVLINNEELVYKKKQNLMFFIRRRWTLVCSRNNRRDFTLMEEQLRVGTASGN